MYKNRLKDKRILFPKFYDYRLRLWHFITKNDNMIYDVFDNVGENTKYLLDIYCKTGTMSIELAKRFPYTFVVGMEENNNLLKIAKNKIRDCFVNNLDFMNLSNLDLYYKHFDVIILYFALNDLSLEGIKSLLEKIKTVLKNHHKLIIVDYHQVSNLFRKILCGIYRLLFHNHLRTFFTLNLPDLLNNLGYEKINYQESEGIKFICCYNKGD